MVGHRQRVSAVEDEQVLGWVLLILMMLMDLVPRTICVKMAANCYVYLTFYSYREGKVSFLKLDTLIYRLTPGSRYYTKQPGLSLQGQRMLSSLSCPFNIAHS